MEYEKCYVFRAGDQRAPKRRRLESSGLQASWKLRRKLYEQTWGHQKNQIDERLSRINAAGVQQISEYLDGKLLCGSSDRVPAGFILSGPCATSQSSIIEHLAKVAGSDKWRIFVSLNSDSGPNLKALLRAIIQKATFTSIVDDEDDIVQVSRQSGPKLLSYDLQILHNHVNENKIAQTVVVFKNTEAFDGGLLSELLELLSCWCDRLRLVCLFNIATSVEFLQQRLSKAAIRCVDGSVFDVKPSRDEVEEVFDALTERSSNNGERGLPKMWIGPHLISSILERQTDYIMSIEAFIEGARFAHMACFYANATSVGVANDVRLQDVPEDHFQAFRQLPSFQQWVKQLLSRGDTETVRQVLENDEALWTAACEAVENGNEKLFCMTDAVDVLRILCSFGTESSAWSKSRLYIQAMSGKLQESALVRSVLLSVRKSSSENALRIMDLLQQQNFNEDQLQALSLLQTELRSLVAEQDKSAQPLRSEDALANSSLRTTIVAQKVSLSKFKTSLTEQDSAYTDIVRRLSDLLEKYFTSAFLDPKHDLPFSEMFVYDLRSPHREVFTPRPRHAIERGLAMPHDYLACDCCTPGKEDGAHHPEETTLSASQPPAAVLYQLYLESEGLINVSDLWHAFHAILGGEEVIPEKQAMALFQRALAELKYFGMIKATRKKTDHIAKVAWRGL